MEGFRALFEEVGIGFEDVVQGTVFLADIDDYAGMNGVYGEYFPTDPPARETVAVKDIVGGAAVEISFIAVKR
jgi:2-iminobutanoate/2-iminopropanoate deaminase